MKFVIYIVVFVSFIVEFNSIHDSMTGHGRNVGTFDGPLDNKDHLLDMGNPSDIHIPPNKRNGVVHITSIVLHMLKIKGLLGGKAHEDLNLHLKKLVEVYAPFDIAHILQKSIWLCFFLLSLMVEAVLWLRSLPVGSIISWIKLTDAFLD